MKFRNLSHRAFPATPPGIHCGHALMNLSPREINVNHFNFMEHIVKNFLNVRSSQSTSVVATAFAVVVTALMLGGYEVTHSDIMPVQANEVASHATAKQPEAVARMETIVVTAKRG